MASRLYIPKSEIEPGMPVRTVTTEMLAWLSDLDVLDTGAYPLPGAYQRRTWAPDPRLDLKTMVQGGINVGPKDSDIVNYYEHVATLHHKTGGYTFVVFRETMDALLAQQRDPIRFPAWLMKDARKRTERKCYMAVVKRPPTGVTSIYDWLTPIEDAFAGTQAEIWMYDALAFFLVAKKVVQEEFISR